MVEDREEGNLHNSYYFELELYQMIKNGNVDDLKNFSPRQDPFEGRKNGRFTSASCQKYFYQYHSKSRYDGLRSRRRMDIEKTYQLMDYYVQECEQIRTIEKINQLQYVMLLGFLPAR